MTGDMTGLAVSYIEFGVYEVRLEAGSACAPSVPRVCILYLPADLFFSESAEVRITLGYGVDNNNY